MWVNTIFTFIIKWVLLTYLNAKFISDDVFFIFLTLLLIVSILLVMFTLFIIFIIYRLFILFIKFCRRERDYKWILFIFIFSLEKTFSIKCLSMIAGCTSQPFTLKMIIVSVVIFTFICLKWLVYIQYYRNNFIITHLIFMESIISIPFYILISSILLNSGIIPLFVILSLAEYCSGFLFTPYLITVNYSYIEYFANKISVHCGGPEMSNTERDQWNNAQPTILPENSLSRAQVNPDSVDDAWNNIIFLRMNASTNVSSPSNVTGLPNRSIDNWVNYDNETLYSVAKGEWHHRDRSSIKTTVDNLDRKVNFYTDPKSLPSLQEQQSLINELKAYKFYLTEINKYMTNSKYKFSKEAKSLIADKIVKINSLVDKAENIQPDLLFYRCKWKDPQELRFVKYKLSATNINSKDVPPIAKCLKDEGINIHKQFIEKGLTDELKVRYHYHVDLSYQLEDKTSSMDIDAKVKNQMFGTLSLSQRIAPNFFNRLGPKVR